MSIEQETQNGAQEVGEASPVEVNQQSAGVAYAPPKLTVEDHGHEIAQAMQLAVNPDHTTGSPIGSTYLQDGKAFIAAFNAALDIISRLQGMLHPPQTSTEMPSASTQSGHAS